MVKTSQIYWQDFVVKKTAHVAEYGVFFILLYRAILNYTKTSKTRAAWISFVIAVLYGISDEMHQGFVAGRESRARDVFFDGFGAALAWILLWKWLPKAPKRLVSLAKNLQVA